MTAKRHTSRRGHRKVHYNPEQKGKEAEKKVFSAMGFFRGSYPSWLIGVTQASGALDSNGVDGIAILDSGHRLYFNIKSSEFGSQHRAVDGIAAVAIGVHDPQRVVYEKMIAFLSDLREKRIVQMLPPERKGYEIHRSSTAI